MAHIPHDRLNDHICVLYKSLHVNKIRPTACTSNIKFLFISIHSNRNLLWVYIYTLKQSFIKFSQHCHFHSIVRQDFVYFIQASNPIQFIDDVHQYNLFEWIASREISHLAISIRCGRAGSICHSRDENKRCTAHGSTAGSELYKNSVWYV